MPFTSVLLCFVSLWGPWHWLGFIVATVSAEAQCTTHMCVRESCVMSGCSTATVTVFSDSVCMCS